MLTDEVYKYICEYIKANYELPTQTIIAEHFGISSNECIAVMRALYLDGRIIYRTCRPANLAQALGHQRGPELPRIKRVHRKPKSAPA